MDVLSNNPDPAMLTAALEGPAALSGLTAQMRAQIEEAYLEANHSATLKAMDDREKAPAEVRAAAEIAVGEIRLNVGLEPHAFDGWFAVADGTEDRRAA